MNSSPAWIAVVLLSAAGLIANGLIMDRKANEVNDAHVGPELSVFERVLRRDMLRMPRYYSAVDERHKELFPQSRLGTVQSTLNYCLLAMWLGFITYSVLTDQ